MGCTDSKSKAVVADSSSVDMASRRPTSASSTRPTVPRRTTLDREKRDSDIVYECKAAYLVIFDDIEDEIKSQKELSKVLQQAGRSPTKKMLSKYWRSSTESLTFEDFCDICRKEPATTEDDLIRAFRKIDLNGDGYITNRELRKMLTQKGERMSEEEVQEIIAEVDENKDGKLDYKEFCNMLLNTQNEAKKMAIAHMERKMKKSSTISHRKGESSPLSGRSQYSASEEDRGSTSTLDTAYDHEKKGSTEDTDGPLEVRCTDAVTEENPSPDPIGEDVMEDQTVSASNMQEKAEVSSQPEKVEEKKNSDDSDDGSDDDIVIGTSRVSVNSKKPAPKGTPTAPKPKPRSRIKSQTPTESISGEYTKVSARGGKEWVKPALASKDIKLPRPKKLKDWSLSHSKGCFFVEEDGSIASHQYTLDLPSDTSVWITIEPFSLKPGGDLNSAREVGNAPIDTMLFVLSEDNSLVTFTDHRDLKGKYGVRCDLEAGRYKLIPFSSGCRFRRRRNEPTADTKLVKKKGDSYTLTKQFKEALSDIFEMCDLDGNGLLSREEFNFFNLRTSGEEVQDTEWDVVKENVELKNGELTRNGFIELNEMEAVDNQGDSEDLWVTLDCMGFNKNLNIDEACTFFMEVYSEDCDCELNVTSLAPAGRKLDQAIVEATIGKGESSAVKGLKDLFLHMYVTDFRACLVVENKSRSKVHINIDCGQSKNCVSNRRHMDHSLEVPPKSAMVAHNLMPERETAEWVIRCQETLE